ncbi:uncharacterized protein [Miscanthus floridulus]|uniref:uncharacterized protein n=1 Tax=Miscanthus floridulus TaxID=154761 RepID=UPI00345849C1
MQLLSFYNWVMSMATTSTGVKVGAATVVKKKRSELRLGMGTTIVDSNILTPMAMNERSHLPLEEEAEFVLRRWISFYLVKEGNRKSIYSDQRHRLRETIQ